jgi:methylamine dehydrogenase heavy chain
MRTPIAAALALALLVPPAEASLAADPPERNVVLPAEVGPHWLWVADVMLRRAALFDGDTGRFLGQVPAGNGIVAPHRSRDGREIYLAETYYARGARGARTDLVSITDARTLAPLGEIEIPGKRSEHTSWVGGSALSDDGRFLAVFNLNPATSLSIVDVARRRFVSEVQIPGCGLVFAGGARRFFSLCADGTARVVTLDEGGSPAIANTERFFDGGADPLIEKGVRHGDRWLFVSYQGVLHSIDVSGPALAFGETWPLFSAAELEHGWRVGGPQNLALHAPSGRLYALVNEGGKDAHKNPGKDVFVYDLAKRARVAEIGLRSPAASFVLEQADGLPGGAVDWLLQRLLPNDGVERIVVTQDAAPVLFAATGFPSTLAVYDATTGAHLRDVREVGVATSLIQLP